MADSSFHLDLIAAQAGASHGFEALYKALNQRVLSYARARGALDADGLVNEVFLRVFRNLAGFDGTRPQFNAWVFTIARNLLVDEQRRRRRRPVEVSYDVAAPPVALASLPAAADEWPSSADSEFVSRCLSHLTADQRDVIVLRIISDLTIDEIAAILDKPPGAIKALQRRAIRTITRALSAQAVPGTALDTFQ